MQQHPMRVHWRLSHAVLTLALAGCSALDAPALPARARPQAVRWAAQGLDGSARTWLHHAPLGEPALHLPLAWFFALEQPSAWVAEKPLLSDPAYLRRFGFLLDADDPTGLPVGFAVHEQPAEDEAPPERTVGLTCAACHTGELEYEGTSFRYDGGPARVSLDRFERALALSVLETLYVPGREARAIARIAGDEPDSAHVTRLERQLETLAAQVQARVDLHRAHRHVEEGFGRVDLPGRMANHLFGHQLNQPKDGQGHAAPVKAAPLWGTPWFDRAGMLGTSRAPLPSYAEKALGLAVRLPPSDTARDAPLATLDVDSLRRVRALLAGPRPPLAGGGFTGLTAPRWPEDLFGPIDRAAALAGERLYDRLCMRCHLPPPNREDFFEETYWTAPAAGGQQRLKLPVVALDEIGTDPLYAQRTGELQVHGPSDPGAGPRPLHEALGELSRGLAARREGESNGAQTTRGYRARPLDGVWATAPYLHNGSVPTLHALLSPLDERPERFTTGHRAFDPRHVGLEAKRGAGLFVFDTQLAGNHNTGHVFDDEPGPGVIGRRLSDEERHQLVEFLKTLESRRLPVGPSPSLPKLPLPKSP